MNVKLRILSGDCVNKERAIEWFEKAIDVFTTFPIENDEKLEAYKMALAALKKSGVNEFAEKRWAVVGFDYDMAEALITAIECSANKDILRRIQTRHELCTEFTDGTLLKWIKPSDSARGQKIGKMWCDKNIDKNIFETVILPIYFGNREDILWI